MCGLACGSAASMQQDSHGISCIVSDQSKEPLQSGGHRHPCPASCVNGHDPADLTANVLSGVQTLARHLARWQICQTSSTSRPTSPSRTASPSRTLTWRVLPSRRQHRQSQLSARVALMTSRPSVRPRPKVLPWQHQTRCVRTTRTHSIYGRDTVSCQR